MIYEPKHDKLVVVPNDLRDLINAKLNAAIAAQPGAEVDRETLYSHLLGVFDEYGYIPEFQLELTKCRFCGDTRPPLDEFGHCTVCVNGMARTNGD